MIAIYAAAKTGEEIDRALGAIRAWMVRHPEDDAMRDYAHMLRMVQETREPKAA